jgi:magnesium-transporting ATPase (P-type)
MLSTIATVSTVAFLLYLINHHKHIENTHSTIKKLYIDNKTLNINGEQLLTDNNRIYPQHSGHFDELSDSLFRAVHFSSIFENQKIYNAIKKFVNTETVREYVVPQVYPVLEELPFQCERKYGGVYSENLQQCGVADIIGDTQAVLGLCSKIHDKEEVERIAYKWQRQGFKVVTVATSDVTNNKKNILKRGVKERMTFLGLIAVEE